MRFARLPSLLLFLVSAGWLGGAEAKQTQKFHYRAEWRLFHAGDVELAYTPPGDPGLDSWQADLKLTTVGFVRSLAKVDSHYAVLYDGGFCAESYLFEVREGKKERDISVTYQQPPGKASYLERDLTKDGAAETKEIGVPPCVHDELAALARLRTMELEPGQVLELPVSNGKKSVSARIEVQEREQIKTVSGKYDTIRCEAFLFKDVLYKRNGRMFVWLTDDERRLPVRIRVRFRFYIGTVTLELVKEEKL